MKKNPIEKSHPTKRQHQSTQHTSTKSLFFHPFFFLQIISFSSRSSKTLEEQGSQVPLLLERKPSKHLLHPKAAGSRPPVVVACRVAAFGVKLPNPPLFRKIGTCNLVRNFLGDEVQGYSPKKGLPPKNISKRFTKEGKRLNYGHFRGRWFSLNSKEKHRTPKCP